MTETIKRGNQIQFFEIVIASTESSLSEIENTLNRLIEKHKDLITEKQKQDSIKNINTEAIQNSQTKDNNSIVLNNNLNSEYKGGVE